MEQGRLIRCTKDGLPRVFELRSGERLLIGAYRRSDGMYHPTLTKPDGKMVICSAVIARTRWQARVEGANVARRVDETYEE